MVALAAVSLWGLIWHQAYWLLGLVLPLIGLGLYDMAQRKHSVLRNYPIAGHWRWILEWFRPMVQQYFVESDTDSAPISRMFRSVVYQRAKNERDTVPLGTRFNTYDIGYEWLEHSLAALDFNKIDADLRVTVGGSSCAQPYRASLLNISAMSYGALSKHAILALNGGARRGDFAHNTGEGGLSPYHLQPGGDLIWQIGTGYFGCRDPRGHFCPRQFAENARLENVKMIEIKLSQGAKPGHGGILPGAKNTAEIASIRHVEPHSTVESPPVHSAFSTPISLMHFIRQLRELTGGKPVGFKLALGNRVEFVALCKAMVETGIRPDFITVDGGEGGTGAAPLEYTNSVGAPLVEALAFVVDCLRGFGLKDEVRVIASGKVFTGFHVVRLLALGADLCNSARGMMLALGCIQSLSCNTNRCPTGVATQDPRLMKGLDIADKTVRVANFHKGTLKSVAELLAATGLQTPAQLTRGQINRRISATKVKTLEEIFPTVEPGSFLVPYCCPARFKPLLDAACPDRFSQRVGTTPLLIALQSD